jgi:hypothetical protein
MGIGAPLVSARLWQNRCNFEIPMKSRTVECGWPIGLGMSRLTAVDLGPANPHRPVIQPRLGGYTPAQVNGLELKPVLLAKLLQLRVDMLLQGIPLVPHVAERRADKDPNDWAEAGVGVACSCLTGSVQGAWPTMFF